MSIAVHFHTVVEEAPGAAWKQSFDRFWPGYRAWFLRSGAVGRPSYLDCRRALRQHMPELESTWQRLVELAGGGDVESRFLSLWCPPPYIAGCSQGVWVDASGDEAPVLLRNYDFAPALLEGSWMATRWRGRRVVAMGDCLWGTLDGMNEAGLAASLSFGGRTVSGPGFGIPLVMRYLLELATTTAEAIQLLKRVPVSMTYSVTLLDRTGDAATVYVAPDRTAEVLRQTAVTNYQHQIEWPEHARATGAVTRLECLKKWLSRPGTSRDVIDALLEPPLFQSGYLRGYGTLYTAAYRPSLGTLELHWPGQQWRQSLARFEAGERDIVYSPDSPPPNPA